MNVEVLPHTDKVPICVIEKQFRNGIKQRSKKLRINAIVYNSADS
jgi:hypothetical protein